MNFKRILRSPIAWIVLAVIAIGLLIDFTQRVSGGYQEEPTSKVVSIINGNEPLEEVILIDRDQEIRVTLQGRQPDQVQGGLGRQPERRADPPAEPAGGGRRPWTAGRAATPTPGFLSQLLGTLIPFIIIGVLFFFLLNSVQGGGSRVMQFGKSKAKIANKDTPKTTFRDVAGCEEADRGAARRSRSSWPSRRSSRRSGPRSPRACCSTARPAPARRCWPAPSPVRRACRSSPSPAPTSWRCSSASARRASATCSSRPRRTPRPSSSSTRSTPSAGTAVPAWAAVTTSASRR